MYLHVCYMLSSTSMFACLFYGTQNNGCWLVCLLSLLVKYLDQSFSVLYYGCSVAIKHLYWFSPKKVHFMVFVCVDAIKAKLGL